VEKICFRGYFLTFFPEYKLFCLLVTDARFNDLLHGGAFPNHSKTD